MASFGTGVATGKLYEMTDITMAADWEKASIHQLGVQSNRDKQTCTASVDNQDTESQSTMTTEKGFNEPHFEALTDNSSATDLQKEESNERLFKEENKKQEILQTATGGEDEDHMHPNLDIGKGDQIAIGEDGISNETENSVKDDTHHEISEDIVTAFERQVQSTRRSQSEYVSARSESKTDPSTSNKNEVKSDKKMIRSDVIMATYTCTKTSKDLPEIPRDQPDTKCDSKPPTRQNTSSSAGDRSEIASQSSVSKPDSGYGRRRQRRRHEDTRSNYSRRTEVSREEQSENRNQESKEPFYRQDNEYLNDRFQSPRQPYDNAATQKTLLELMTKGLGNFTEQMADVMIGKLRPEYEILSRKVATEVQEATTFELKELRDKIINAQKALKELEKDKENLKKHLDAEKSKRLKEVEEKDAHIKKLEKELEQSKNSVKERDRVLKKAELRAKGEEQKRIQQEQEYEKQCTNLKRLLDRAKGDLLVYRSKKRVALTVEKQEALDAHMRLNSHH